ncbi:MAG TPA: glycine--tRNA ligase subunit beta [Thermoanaerobaculia bacterium]|nr:glycine--tRNA ligase subunit beta [Thermoanaerobaculia bacterium]
MSRDDFLLEIRTEEIPAAALAGARMDLQRHITDALEEEGLVAEVVESFATPRRLILLLRGLPDRQKDRFSEVLGPAASAAYDAEGKPTRAAEGFARAQKVHVSELEVVQSPRGPTVAARRTIPGRAAVEVLSQIVPHVVPTLTFPKTMRWGAGASVFVRPVRGVLALLGGRVVPLEIFGIAATDKTVGHRILSDGEIAVSSVEGYFQSLRRAHVEPDAEERRLAILKFARRMARELGGSVESDADLASTLAGLVEWPGVVRGAFAPDFLGLPEEITTTVMRVHQKYLPVRGPSGLLPYFLAVMDNVEDRKGLIAKGNEWVLNARLADARFFYEEDGRKTLESRLPELASLNFQERLGDYRQKTGRLQELSETIAHTVGRPDLTETVLAAARLSKTDLTTRMVKEFTDLQGIVGGLYARREGHPDPVWKAIYDQYRPAGAADDPPREAAGAILSLADRFDTLVGLFLAGLIPTGSKDPYGLRRSALGIVSIAIACGWRLDWKPVARRALSLYPLEAAAVGPSDVLEELEKFFAERLRSLLERRGHAYDEVSAVLNVGVWDFADAADRAQALTEARRQIDFRSLILAFKRIRNILGTEGTRVPSSDLYRESAERELAGDFQQARRAIEELRASRRYRESLEMIASIAPALDRFFVEVLVNCPEEDLRRNRLALLGSIQKEFSRLADFSEIVVEK